MAKEGKTSKIRDKLANIVPQSSDVENLKGLFEQSLDIIDQFDAVLKDADLDPEDTSLKIKEAVDKALEVNPLQGKVADLELNLKNAYATIETLKEINVSLENRLGGLTDKVQKLDSDLRG